jgi:GTPase
MEPESFYGNIEYKLNLNEKTDFRFEKLVSQMRFRMEEGGGECIYMLGVKDNGICDGITDSEYEFALSKMKEVAIKNNYTICAINETVVNNISTDKEKEPRKIYEFLVREKNENSYIDLKISIAGNVDAGKSSLLGVLTSQKFDDGRGSARSSIFNYKHELKSGRTTSIAHHILGFDESGKVVNNERLGKMSWAEIIRKSKKVASFFDLAGHEKYIKTTITGLSSCAPDFCMILVSANAGIKRMTLEHMLLCLTLKIPFVIVVTKIDITKNRENVYDENMELLYKILKRPNILKKPYIVRDTADVIMCSKQLYTDSCAPIFHVSNVTGEGIDHLTKFINITGKRLKDYNSSSVEFHIDTIYNNIRGVGMVVAGNLVSGKVKIGDNLLIGPTVNNKYEKVTIKSIHCKKVPLESINFASYVCFGVKNVDKEKIKKGCVIVSSESNAVCVKRFTSEIKILKTHSTTVRVGYEPTIYTSSIRQTAKIISVTNKENDRNIEYDEENQNILRAGDKALVTFEFKYNPVFLKKGSIIFLNEGSTKGIGIVDEILI